MEDDDVEKKEDDDVEEEDRSQGPGLTLCASLRGRNARQHFTRATFYGHLQEKCCRPELAQKADPHVVEPAQSKCMSTFHKTPLYIENYR